MRCCGFDSQKHKLGFEAELVTIMSTRDGSRLPSGLVAPSLCEVEKTGPEAQKKLCEGIVSGVQLRRIRTVAELGRWRFCTINFT